MLAVLEGLYYLVVGVTLLVTTGFLYLAFGPRLELDNDAPNSKSSDSDKNKLFDEVALSNMGTLPPVFPNGWYVLLMSHELKRGQARPATALGKEFAVFRDESGDVHVLDAYCPHLGAHLGYGGKVTGSCISCPFHGWSFRGTDGKCIDVPYSEKAPQFAKVKVWTHCEKNGTILLWFHAEEEPPQWEPPDIPEIQEGKWSYQGRVLYTVTGHIQDIAENGADFAHLHQLHSSFVGAGQVFEPPWWHKAIRHDWSAVWEEGPEPHLAKIKLVHRLLIFGRNIRFGQINVDITQVGPSLVYLRLNNFFTSALTMLMVRPEGALRLKLSMAIFSRGKFSNAFMKIFLFGDNVQVARDVFIWNHKRFIKSPILVKEEGSILKFRRWFSQFYSEHSPTIKSIRESYLDW